MHVGDAEVIVLASSEHAAREGESVELQVRLREVHIFAAAEDDDHCVRIGAAAPRERVRTTIGFRVRRTIPSDGEQGGRRA